MDKPTIYTNYIGLSDSSTWTTMAWVHFVQASWARLHPLNKRFGCWSNIMGNKGYQPRRRIRWEERSGQFSDAGRLSSWEFHLGATAKCSRMWTVVRISRQIPEIWHFMRTGCRSSFCIGSRRNSSGAQRMVPDLTGVHLFVQNMQRRGPTAKNKVLQLVKAVRKTCRVLDFSCWVSQKIVIYSNFLWREAVFNLHGIRSDIFSGVHGGVYLQVMQSLFGLFPPPDSHGSVKNGCIWKVP